MSPRTRTLALAFGALLLTFGATGCEVEDRSADARIHWSFAGMDCRAANVAIVQVIMDPYEGGTYADSGALRCEEGSVRFYDLDRGLYRVRVLGFRPSGGYASWDADVDYKLYRGFNEATIDLVPSGSL